MFSMISNLCECFNFRREILCHRRTAVFCRKILEAQHNFDICSYSYPSLRLVDVNCCLQLIGLYLILVNINAFKVCYKLKTTDCVQYGKNENCFISYIGKQFIFNYLVRTSVEENQQNNRQA